MKKILSWVYVVVWCSVIFFFSSIPDLKIKELGFLDLILRKIAHILEYAILGILFKNAFFVSFNIKEFNSDFFSFILSFIYAVSDEIHQKFVPGRHFALSDIGIDGIGIILGIILWNRFLKFKLYKNQKP
ncbi:MAG: VanZ family protein [Elusimicrobiota bacterium]|nr:VanZ family protein [Endomicrobiia bacterium]MCX7910284.1 VanZ family protein [Endomicrobiia bacterium]MDW8165784.1 VanZ family protein [Elusimicrobiota bacterium]